MDLVKNLHSIYEKETGRLCFEEFKTHPVVIVTKDYISWLENRARAYEAKKDVGFEKKACTCHVKKTDLNGLILLFAKHDCPAHKQYSQLTPIKDD